tara:strand:+ start:533 stop:1540 length:1008 start_codon:yes stop_codon:yes gene_type:complete
MSQENINSLWKEEQEFTQSSITRRLKEDCDIPSDLDIAKEISSKTFGKEFTFKHLFVNGESWTFNGLTKDEREKINNLSRAHKLDLFCKLFGQKNYVSGLATDELGLPHEKELTHKFSIPFDSSIFLEYKNQLQINDPNIQNKFDTQSKWDNPQSYSQYYSRAYLDDIEIVWNFIYQKKTTRGYLNPDKQLLLGLVQYLINRLQKLINDDQEFNRKNKFNFLHPEFKDNLFYLTIAKGIFNTLFQQHHTYYRKFLTKSQVEDLFFKYKWTEVNTDLGISEISWLIKQLNDSTNKKILNPDEILRPYNKYKEETEKINTTLNVIELAVKKEFFNVK